MSDRPRLLLVDDALVIRALLTDLLKKTYDVVGDAGNGRDAVRLADELKPDLIVMDVTMPEMDGIEATRQIHDRHPEIDIVILSAVTSDASIKAGLEAGARDYLAKPPKPPEIMEVLARLVKQRASRANQGDDAGGLPGRGIWSFVSAVGGDGRTTLLLSLANELLSLGRRVVVVDADLVFGDVGFYLDIPAEGPGLKGVIDPAEQINDENVLPAIHKHPSGLEVLAQPPLAEPVFDAQPTKIIELVHFLNRSFEYVLVDFPVGVPDALLPLLDDSRYVFPVSRGLPERLKNFRNLIRVLSLCGFAPPRMCPVLTQTDEGASQKFVEGFQLGVQAYFPQDREAVAEATKAAQPVTRVAPRSGYTQRVRDFVGEVLKIPKADEGGGAAKPGLLARLGLGKG